MFRAAIIGCGRIASEFELDNTRKHPYTHAGACTKHKEIELIAAADIDKQKLNTFSKMWHVKNVYMDFIEMIDKNDIDIVSVCTPEHTHYEIVKKLVGKVKLIFCEKPLASNTQNAREMVELCKKKNTRLAVNHSRRWDVVFNEAKKMIDGPVSIYGQYTSGLMVMGTHMIDLMRFYYGDVKEVIGFKEPVSAEKLDYSENYSKNDPAYSGVLIFKNGCIGFLDGSTMKENLVFDISLSVKGGKVSVLNNGEKILDTNNNEIQPTGNTMMFNAVNNLVKNLKNNKSINCTGEDGLRTIEIAESLKRSNEKGCVVKL